MGGHFENRDLKLMLGLPKVMGRLGKHTNFEWLFAAGYASMLRFIRIHNQEYWSLRMVTCLICELMKVVASNP